MGKKLSEMRLEGLDEHYLDLTKCDSVEKDILNKRLLCHIE